MHSEAVSRFEKLKGIKRLDHLGTILSLEIEQEEEGYYSSIRDQLYHGFIKRGFLLRPLGNVVYILPPFTISKSELESVYDVINEVLIELGVCE